MKPTNIKPFGKFFNGEERKLPTPENPEPNTPEEAKVVADVNNHLAFKTEPLPKNSAKIIQHLLKTKQYSDFIVKPDTRLVYRGISVSEEDLLNIGKKIGKEIDTKNQRIGSFDIVGLSFFFEPQSGRAVSSWSRSSEAAHDFASYIQVDEKGYGFETKKKFGLMLGAQVSKNQYKFWDLRKWYEEIDSSLRMEAEVIGIGKIYVRWVKWFKI